MTALKAAAATSHFIDVNGIKLHYLDYGVAGHPPMLCVHGAAAHAHWFDFVAPGLTPGHHVRSLDLRGHGDSAWAEQHSYDFRTFAADLKAVVEALDLRDFVLMGHSMGGMVSLLYAATYPGRVGRLIVVDTMMLMPMERIEKMRAFGLTPPSSYDTQADLVARYRLNPPDTHIAPPEVIRHMAMHSGREGADGRWQHKADRRVYANSQQMEGMLLWDEIKIPALVIKGERSTRFGPEEMAQIRARAPQVRMREVSASNHHITLDNPNEFVEVVREFLHG
jgi:pimeloyl-ACP methyl ester carboxylesterase